MRAISMTRHWYVVHTKPHQETLAAYLLHSRFALATLLPEVVQHRSGRRQRAPLFPGYLFIEMDLDLLQAAQINTTPGIIRLVTFGERPQPVADAVIIALQQKLTEIETQGGLINHPFHEGDAVRLTQGPLAGLEAIFVGPMRPTERVRILLEFLGQEQEAWVSVGDLETAAAAPTVKRERRTRGQGRLIKHSLAADTR